MDRLYQSENLASFSLLKKYVTKNISKESYEDSITLPDGTLKISYQEECIDQFD